MEYIYVLKCKTNLQSDKFFVGKTYNVQIEYNEHLDKKFDFTKDFKHTDIDIDSVFENVNLELVISKYINKYGKSNVHFISLEEKQIKKIKKLIKEPNDKCICKKTDHFLDKCHLNLTKEFWDKMMNRVINTIVSDFKKNCNESDICCRCGRFGHFMDQCYAKKHADGYTISDEEQDNEFI